jgi:large subunit ribosomal protein L28
MSRKCELSGKKGLVGNNVSHAKNRTKMKQEVNLHNKKFFDPETGKTYRLKLSAKAIKTLDKVGSFAKFRKLHPELL